MLGDLQIEPLQGIDVLVLLAQAGRLNHHLFTVHFAISLLLPPAAFAPAGKYTYRSYS
jgi:hypothetical protein